MSGILVFSRAELPVLGVGLISFTPSKKKSGSFFYNLASF